MTNKRIMTQLESLVNIRIQQRFSGFSCGHKKNCDLKLESFVNIKKSAKVKWLLL